ncbi:MAG: bile acid transporter family protein [Verrucomicrobiaceae bacterium]|nr:bile acid transporter family protein [Verrucomicrobiaceae bacterium]
METRYGASSRGNKPIESAIVLILIMTSMKNFLDKFTSAFPLVVTLCSVLALWHPPLFTWFSGLWITLGLGVIMLGMGITLTAQDFTRIVQMPGWVLPGVILHYTIMPLSGWAIAKLLALPDAYAVGLILVACCPCGTASNVISYLSRANVALSVTLTTFSTILAVVMTPWLTSALAGSRMEINAWGLFVSCLEVVLVPTIAGVLLNRYSPQLTKKATRISPAIAVLVIALIVASVLGAGRTQVLQAGPRLLLGVLMLHVSGFGLGYLFSYWINRSETVARTISIEVGMQNSGLGAQLARAHFPAGSGVDVPSAISALMHCILGSVLAAVWRRRPPQN